MLKIFYYKLHKIKNFKIGIKVLCYVCLQKKETRNINHHAKNDMNIIHIEETLEKKLKRHIEQALKKIFFIQVIFFMIKIKTNKTL